MRKTTRGFRVYGVYKDNRKNTITIQESSSAAGAFCWIFVKNKEGKEVYTHLGQHYAVSPHLNKRQAGWIANALLKFAETK